MDPVMTKIAETKIPPIRNGTVIDHITNGQALNVLKILGANENNIDSTISIGMHVSSSKGTGWKDVIKLEDKELEPEIVDKIALIAPKATIAIIRDYYIAEKFEVALGERVIGLAKCSNPNCITNRGEPVDPEFIVEENDPPKLRCIYCDRTLVNITENLL